MANSTTETPEARARRLGWEYSRLWGAWGRGVELILRSIDGDSWEHVDRAGKTVSTHPTLTAALDAIHGEEVATTPTPANPRPQKEADR